MYDIELSSRTPVVHSMADNMCLICKLSMSSCVTIRKFSLIRSTTRPINTNNAASCCITVCLDGSIGMFDSAQFVTSILIGRHNTTAYAVTNNNKKTVNG